MHTLSQIVSKPRREGSKPALYVGLYGDDPRTPSARVSLAGFDRALLGRGVSGVSMNMHEGGKQLVLTLADPRMSSQHARLVRYASQWVVVDLDSKNGTYHGGEAIKEQPLADGDTLMVGHTALVFREQGGELGDFFGRPQAAHPNLATFAADAEQRFESLIAAATSKVPIELTGESGTGKELAARAVHALSGRTGAFVAVNCGALPPTLLEAELFGHKKGAYTGSVGDRVGFVRSADRGTLFLDEVAELPAASQAALLRVLQEGEVMPLGADKPIEVDIRIVTATLKDLSAEVAAKRFREDLRARLLGVRLAMPPLRERREDLGWLVTTLLERIAPGRRVAFSADTVIALYRYDWPLNIRELERTLAAAVAVAGERIEIHHLPEELRAIGRSSSGTGTKTDRPSKPPGVVREMVRDPEPLTPEDERLRETVRAAVERHQGNLSAVARELGKDRKQIQRWVKRFGLQR